MGTLHRQELDQAWMEWRQHPMAETRDEFERQQRFAEFERLGLSAAMFVVLAGATIFVYWLKQGEPDSAANESQPVRSETNTTSSTADSRR